MIFKRKIRNAISICIGLSFTAAYSYAASEFMPSTIYKLDKKFNHHVLVVEKSTHSLYLYKNTEGTPDLIKKFKIMTGKFTGNKRIQGDKKTPEGIYFFQKFHSSEFLLNKYGDYGKIYGAGAFTTNYPNEIDRRLGKTGSGIWLHSSDDDGRISLGQDSRGCVVAINKDLREISQYIDLAHTPVVITQDLHFQTKENWEKNKKDILATINTWSKAWQEKDFDKYINSYSKSDFIHNRRGRYNKFKVYKRAVFARKDKPEISFTDISVLHNGQYVVATMEQDYNSPFIQDIGKKTLYLKRNDQYEWKIVAEEWSKIEEQRSLAFTPKMRYFSEQTSKKDVVNDSESI